jgi:hypothetical protein
MLIGIVIQISLIRCPLPAAAERVALKDAPIEAAACKAKVDLLVTLDKKHLLGKPALAKYVGAEIVAPKEAVKRLV